MAKRKIENSHTTISITWTDKEDFRRLAKLVKTTKNGDMYESDSAIFSRMLGFYKSSNEVGQVSHNTYPTKTFPKHDQQG